MFNSAMSELSPITELRKEYHSRQTVQIQHSSRFSPDTLLFSAFTRILLFGQNKGKELKNDFSERVWNHYLNFDQLLAKTYFLFFSHGTFLKVHAFSPKKIQTYKHLRSANI